jgi:Ca2+-binding EF-hand superfamily protein
MGNSSRSLKITQNYSKDNNRYDFYYISKDTGLTINEIQSWHDSFMIDCPKGKLSRRRFYKVYKKFYPYGKPLNFSNLIFNTFDEDQDNILDFHEFVKAISIVLHGNLEQKLKCAFKIYDSNGDGVIDKREMKMVINSIYQLFGEEKKQLKKAKLTEKKVDDIFAKLDTNRDNYISLKEFIDGYLNDQYLLRLLNINQVSTNINFETVSNITSEISDESIQYSSTVSNYEDYETETEYVSYL